MAIAGRNLLIGAIAAGCLFIAGTVCGYFIRHDQILPDKLAKAVAPPPAPSSETIVLPPMPPPGVIDPWQSPWFRLRYGFMSAFPVRTAVVMVGDSITEGADWHVLLRGIDLVNQGIGGDTTVGLLKRVDLVKRTGARTIALMFGVNDLLQGQPVDQVYSRYAQAVSELAEPGKCVIVQSTLLTRRGAAVNRSIAALNAEMAAYCKSGKCAFLDLNAKIAVDGELPAEATVDGIHPTPVLYASWRDMLVPYLASCGQ